MFRNDEEYAAYKDHVMEILNVGCNFRTQIDYTQTLDQLASEVVEIKHRFEANILADKLAEDEHSHTVTVPVPLSTWQMFKKMHYDAWWLAWLVDRYPVKMSYEYRQVTVKVDRYLAYPEAALQIPELGRPVIHEVVHAPKVTRN